MTIKIKDLRIRAFRGIRELRIPFERKSLLLLGENGTGKSSVVEALEFFFTGSIERLVGEGTQGLSISRHATHVLHDEADTEIELAFDPGGIEVKRSLHDGPEFSDSLASYFRGAENGTFVLRQRRRIPNTSVTTPICLDSA